MKKGGSRITYRHHYTNGPHSEYADYVSETGALPFTVFDVFHPSGDYPDPPVPEFALFSITKGNAKSHFGYGGRRMNERCRPGVLGLAPPSVSAEYTTDGPLGYVGIAIPEPTVDLFFQESAGASSNCLNVLHQGTFRNDALAALLPLIACEAKAGHLKSDIVADAMLVTILSLLDSSARPHTSEKQIARLSRSEIRLLTEFIEENLGHPIRLFELANLLGVSEAHLVRACKTSLGLTPHRFVMARRLDKACTMISTSKESFVQIALAAGFSSQSHMSDTIRRHTGITPRSLRKKHSN
ncbi:MAG: AraC family transcriptional regulator [Pseudomonadota bacterium]